MTQGRRPSSKPITAADLVGIKDNMMRSDSAYRSEVERVENERRDRVAKLRDAERPIVNDLHRVGVNVSSVWDLNTSEPYPAALPVLLKHLEQGGYPDRVMESLGSAMAVGPAVFAWDRLRDLYLHADGHGEEEGLAVALAASATPTQLDSLIGLLGEDSRGDTRIHFLRAIKRVGGSRGRGTLESLRSDPLFGKEASALLKRRR